MRIALVGPVYPYRGGISHFNGHLAHYLHKNGHEVRVFSFKRQYPDWLYPGESDRDTSTSPLQTNATFILDPFLPWTWTDCANQIQSWKPDLVLIAWWTTFWWLAFSVLVSMLNRRGIKTAFLIHNIIPHEVRWWDRLVTGFTLRRSSRFMVQSDSQRERLLEIKPDAFFHQSPHPIFNLLSTERIDKIGARSRLGVAQDSFTLLFLGIVRPYKGLQNLIKAVHILKENNHPVSLVIAGEFWESLADHRSLIQQLDLSENVMIFPGYIPNEQLADYFSAADLFVAPYISGTQSGVAKLALGFGLPAMITESIADELLRKYEGRGVTIAKSPDPNDLVDAIIHAQTYKHDGNDFSRIADQSWDAFIRCIQKLALIP
jgi:glycosyltransferase involved in cell wall biosynthesis